MKKFPVQWWAGGLLIPVFSMVGFLARRRVSQGDLLGNGFAILDLVITLVLLAVGLTSLAVIVHRGLRTYLRGKFTGWVHNQRSLAVLILICLLAAYESFQDLLFLAADMDEIHYQGYRQILGEYRLLLFGLLVAALLTLSAAGWARQDLVGDAVRKFFRSKLLYVFLISSAVLLSISASQVGRIFQTDLGRNFGPLPVPLLGIQVLLLMGGILLAAVILCRLQERGHKLQFLRNDILVMLLLALAAFGVWSSVSLRETTFIDQKRPPNQEYYPTSDALYYEQSVQSMLAGNGLDSDSHAGFKVYLGLLHRLGGNQLGDILPLKLILLSLTPALLYGVTAALTNRTSGIIVGCLSVIKGWNTLILGEHITLASVMDVMTEPITALVILGMVFLIIRWMEDPGGRQLLPLLAGGAAGAAIMFRVEAAALVPAVGICILGYFWKQIRTGVRGLILIAVGLMLILAPWMGYRFLTTGSPSVLLLGKGNYFEQDFGPVAGAVLEAETQQAVDPENTFVNHAVNNLLGFIYPYPSNHQPLLTAASLPELVTRGQGLEDMEGDFWVDKYLERYVRSLPYWWRSQWNGRLESRSVLPVLGSLFLMLVGVRQVRGRKRWWVVMLGLFVVFHTLLYARVEQSGGRSIQIISWIPLIFYGSGLAWVGAEVRKISGFWKPFPWLQQVRDPLPQEDKLSRNLKLWQFSAAVVLLLLLGLSVPAADQLIPIRYPQAGLEDQISNLPAETQQLVLMAAGDSSDHTVVYGRALFPRWYKADQKMEDIRGGRIPDYSFKRTEFYLVGSKDTWVAIRSYKDQIQLPHAADVIVVGTREDAVYGPNGEKMSGEYIKAIELIQLSSQK